MKKIVEDIIATDTGNDFIVFKALGFEEISPQRKYKGISFQVIGQINNTKTPFSVDIGIDDVIIPKSEKREIPVQLDDFQKPVLVTYSLESTVAEKFDAMLQRLELTSRMKVFYDIYYISNVFDFDGRHLQEAIINTLQNRGTFFESNSLNKIVLFSEKTEMQVQWRRFLQRSHLPELSFEEVLYGINIFLKPVWQAITSDDEFSDIWNAPESTWEKV